MAAELGDRPAEKEKDSGGDACVPWPPPPPCASDAPQDGDKGWSRCVVDGLCALFLPGANRKGPSTGDSRWTLIQKSAAPPEPPPTLLAEPGVPVAARLWAGDASVPGEKERKLSPGRKGDTAGEAAMPRRSVSMKQASADARYKLSEGATA